MQYKIMSENGKLIEWLELTEPIVIDDWLPIKNGPYKVIMVGMLEYDTSTKKPHIPVWTRDKIKKRGK